MQISFIGSGNVASFLSQNLYAKGYKIKHIYSKTFANAEALSKKVNATPLHSLSSMQTATDEIIVIAAKDDSLEEITSKIATCALVVHTAGSIPIEILSKFQNHGVLYPMQTFSKNKHVNPASVHFFIEANSKENENRIKALALAISNTVNILSSSQRMLLHISAVLSCNFTNHLFALSEDILKTINLDFSILTPLLRETVEKALIQGPTASQTGPAIRKDEKIIEKHLKNLDLFPKHQEIYKILSDSIIQKEKWQISKKN